MTMAEETGMTLQKGLSEWWSEETEYVFQRIERWAAFARGYNRLRSQRLSRGRMTMQEEPEPRWSISSNKLVIDDFSWSPRFHNLKKSRRKSRPEERTRINCCGSFSYQANSKLDSSCLETYRYDHSIYFKTIGDIKNSKKDKNEENDMEERISISSEELVEWNVEFVSEFIANQYLEENENEKNISSDNGNCNAENWESDNSNSNVENWTTIDLNKLNLNVESTEVAATEDTNKNNIGWEEEETKYSNEQEKQLEKMVDNQEELISSDTEDKEEVKSQDGIKRFLSFRRGQRSSWIVKQPVIVGNNNMI